MKTNWFKINSIIIDNNFANILVEYTYKTFVEFSSMLNYLRVGEKCKDCEKNYDYCTCNICEKCEKKTIAFVISFHIQKDIVNNVIYI